MSLDTLLSAAMAGTNGLMADTDAAPEPWGIVTAPSPERALLLRAGAWTVYTQAGRLSAPAPPVPAPAPDDRHPPCGPAVTALLRRLLDQAGSPAIIAEAFRVMATHQLRLPHAMLPDLLSHATAAVREAALPVIGTRGVWLAAQREDWAWAAGARTDDAPWDETSALTAWDEGAWPERLAALVAAHRHAPAVARTWLAAALPKEKPDQRVKLLEAIAATLGPDDAPFLEGCLGDRSAQVRAQAVRLLLRLPASAMATRLAERAEALLTGASLETLTLTPPESWPKAWEREGLTEQGPSGLGPRGWWLWQALSLVPPTHWEQRLATTPEALIARLETDHWGVPALVGLAQAAQTHRSGAWAMPLLASLGRQLGTASGELHDFMRLQRSALLSVMPPEALSAMAVERLEADDAVFARAPLEALSAPWGEAVATALLAALARHAQSPPAEGTVGWRSPWTDLADLGAFKLSPARAPEVAALAEALGAHEASAHLARPLERLAETLTWRQRIHKEITP